MGGHRISPQIRPYLSVSQSPARYRARISRPGLKKAEEVMEILEAYDLTGSFRQAAALVGCDHKTVAQWVEVREQTGGAPPARAKHRRPVADAVSVKIEELVDRSRGQIRADQTHRKLVAMGYEGPSAAGARSTVGAPADCRRLPPLRADGRDLRAGRPPVEGWFGEHGEDREGGLPGGGAS
jgi:hypothetical protein